MLSPPALFLGLKIRAAFFHGRRDRRGAGHIFPDFLDLLLHGLQGAGLLVVIRLVLDRGLSGLVFQLAAAHLPANVRIDVIVIVLIEIQRCGVLGEMGHTPGFQRRVKFVGVGVDAE